MRGARTINWSGAEGLLREEEITMSVLVYAESKDRKTLADKLVAYSEMPRQEAEDLASIAGPGPYIPLPLMDPSPILKEFPAEAQRTFRYQALMMEEDIMSGYPLAIDEDLLEDGLLTRCLAEAAIVYPRGTMAVRRRTTRGEIVFLNHDLTIDFDRKVLVDNRPDSSPEALATAKAEEVVYSWGDLGMDIGKALLGALANKIGSGIFARFFPPSAPPYFAEVYEQFRLIVRQAIEENSIRLLVGEVAAVQTHMIAYARHRESGNNQAAQQEIAQAWNRSVLATNKLLQFPVAGLGPFLTAGGLHLAIVQERALRDPEANDPNDSSWASVYRDALDRYLPYVGTQPDKIVRDRAAHITEVVFRRVVRTVPRHGPIDESYWWWRDPVQGGERRYSWRIQRAEQTARNARATHYASVINPLNNSLNPVREVARSWQQARGTPLPPVET
jgi:hypothetical protein